MMQIRKLMTAVLLVMSVAVLNGCVQREIVMNPTSTTTLVPDVVGNTEALSLDDIDWDQVYDGVDSLMSNNPEYPMGKYISVYTMENPVDTEMEEDLVVVEWCVADECTGDTACDYGEALISVVNDEIAVQDATIRDSRESDYGGFFDKHPVLVRIYHQSAESEPLESEVYQYIQEGTHGGCMKYYKASELETMDDVESYEANFGSVDESEAQ